MKISTKKLKNIKNLLIYLTMIGLLGLTIHCSCPEEDGGGDGDTVTRECMDGVEASLTRPIITKIGRGGTGLIGQHFIEIANPTCEDIDVSNWFIDDVTNGGGACVNRNVYLFPAGAQLEAQSYFLIGGDHPARNSFVQLNRARSLAAQVVAIDSAGFSDSGGGFSGQWSESMRDNAAPIELCSTTGAGGVVDRVPNARLNTPQAFLRRLNDAGTNYLDTGDDSDFETETNLTNFNLYNSMSTGDYPLPNRP